MPKRQQDHLDPIPRDRPSDDPDNNQGVAIARLTNGRAVLIPKALRDLSGEALEPVSDLQHVAAEIGHLQGQLVELVGDCRDVGVSWNSIGWCLGITGQSAYSRFGPAPEDRAPKKKPAARRKPSVRSAK